jgi:hypothetical protein
MITEKKIKAPPNQTLENVAEEMLNGMFCHYEPPDQKRKNHRGILRTASSATSGKVNPQQVPDEGKRGIRWSDKVESSFPKPPTIEAQCNIARHCVDGCTEAGIIASPTVQQKAQDFAAKYDYDKLQMKRYKDSPPPPPPPPRQEKRGGNPNVLSDICGVSIKCGADDDDQTAVKPYRRPKQVYDYDEDHEHNSITSDSEDDDDEEDSVPKKSRKPGSPPCSVSSWTSGSDIEQKSGTSSLLNSWWPGAKTFDQDEEDHDPISTDRSIDGSAKKKESAQKKKGLMKRTSDEFDPITRVRSDEECGEIDSEVEVIHVKSRASTRNPESDDWDSTSLDKKKKEKASRWSLTGRSLSSKKEKKSRRASSPGPARDRRSGRAERLSLDSVKTKSERVDSDVALAKLSEYPKVHPAHPLNSSGFDESRDDAMERQSYITADRQGFGDDLSQLDDDMMERQSFITASREGLDVASLPLGNPVARLAPIREQFSDRQSYISEHRRAMESPRKRMVRQQQVQVQNQQQRGGRGRSNSPRRSKSPTQIGRSLESEPQQMRRTHSVERDITRNQGNRSREGMIQHIRYQYPGYANIPPPPAGHRIGTPLQGMPLLQPDQSMPHGPYYQNGMIQQQHVSVQRPVMHPPLGPYLLAGQYSQPPHTQQVTQEHQPSFVSEHQAVHNGSIQQVPTLEQAVAVPEQPNEAPNTKPNEAPKTQEQSWEERTRTAWDRLRGGIVGSLNLDSPPTGDDSNAKRGDDDKTTDPSSQLGQPADSQPQQPLPVQPVGILRNVHDRRVTFGPSREQIFHDVLPGQQIHHDAHPPRQTFYDTLHSEKNFYYDEQDENIYLETLKRRKKKVFRGMKIFSGLFGKSRKAGFGKDSSLKLDQSRSVDVTASNSVSQEWDEDLDIFTDPRQPVVQPHQLYQPVYAFPSSYAAGNHPSSQPIAPVHPQRYYQQPLMPPSHPQQQTYPSQTMLTQQQQEQAQLMYSPQLLPSQQPPPQQQSYYASPHDHPVVLPSGNYYPQQQHQPLVGGMYYHQYK